MYHKILFFTFSTCKRQGESRTKKTNIRELTIKIFFIDIPFLKKRKIVMGNRINIHIFPWILSLISKFIKTNNFLLYSTTFKKNKNTDPHRYIKHKIKKLLFLNWKLQIFWQNKNFLLCKFCYLSFFSLMKAELQELRRKGALRPSVDGECAMRDGGRSCSRCRAELGWIVNRGAVCPACRLRVCRACREYTVRTIDWVCTVCYKRT